LLRRGRALAQRDRDLRHAGIAQVERVGVTLAAVADNGDLLALDQVQVGVAIVINTHDAPLRYRVKSAMLLGRPDTADKARMPLKIGLKSPSARCWRPEEAP